MRNLRKLDKPTILEENADTWTRQWLDDRESLTKKYRYRHSEIKERLKEETGYKCVYCESKIGHNVSGDIEHKVPSSKVPEKAFEWDNLTIACPECNRRKNNIYEENNSFLDPYTDDVESLLKHLGPFVLTSNGDSRAEIALRALELSNNNRAPLILRKMEHASSVANLIERWRSENNQTLKNLLLRQIWEMSHKTAEYSAMVLSILEAANITQAKVAHKISNPRGEVGSPSG